MTVRWLLPRTDNGYIYHVIMPHLTRKRIARALSILKVKKGGMVVKKQDNLPL